ncbi:MAG: helix-turn-helix transcriptional regulator [Spirochaetes bacterium]|nr:helix-turn-helix transcriptional regulator [Spirochaetota bacterium]
MNIRVFLLCAVVAPLIILASQVLDNETQRTNRWVILFCILLGVLYVVFNTLGTKDSYTLFELYGLTAYDNLTPSRIPPFYGREVTLIAQTSIGVVLLVFSLVRLRKLTKQRSEHYFFFKKNLFINSGILVFALSFIVGSVLKQWWIYYVTSIVISMLFGGSVLYDIKELNIFHEKTLPLLKHEIVNRLFSNDGGEKEIVELMTCIGKNTELNCAAVIQINPIPSDRVVSMFDGKFEEMVIKQLSKYYPEECLLTLPIFGNTLGVLFKVDKLHEEYKNIELFERVGERIKEMGKESIVIGIGSIKSGIGFLGESFYEAMLAKKYALNNQIEGVVYYRNIKQSENDQRPYPYREKQLLVEKLRVGDVHQIERLIEEVISKLKLWAMENVSSMKLKAYEMIGSLVTIIDAKSGERDKLNELIEKSFKNISNAKEIGEIERVLREVTYSVVTAIRNQYQKRTNLYISKAREFIEKKYKYPITFKKVAEYIGVSPSYFLHLFKKEMGITFSEYVTNIRIQMAKKFLLEGKLTITEIAYEVGFRNPNYFSYVFKKTVGISAKEFKRSIGKGEDPYPHPFST